MLKSEKYIAIVFDVDGVLADTEPLRYNSYRQLFMQIYNVELPDKIPLEIIGRGEVVNLKYFLALFGLDGDADKLRRERAGILAEIIERQLRPLPGLYFLLDKLEERGIRLAVATNSSMDYTNKLLSLLNIEDRFSVIVTGEDVEKAKPNPEIYLKAAEKMDIEPDYCIAVEDSINGIMAAKSAGMKCIAITSSFLAEKLDMANLVVKDLHSIAGMDYYKFLSL